MGVPEWDSEGGCSESGYESEISCAVCGVGEAGGEEGVGEEELVLVEIFGKEKRDDSILIPRIFVEIFFGTVPGMTGLLLVFWRLVLCI